MPGQRGIHELTVFSKIENDGEPIPFYQLEE